MVEIYGKFAQVILGTVIYWLLVDLYLHVRIQRGPDPPEKNVKILGFLVMTKPSIRLYFIYKNVLIAFLYIFLIDKIKCKYEGGSICNENPFIAPSINAL